jgi:predicted GNAT family N-acyltransferase
MDDIERRELRLFPSPPWHLAPIGVLPSEQGKGAAGLLLHTRIARIDSEQGSVYIATQDEKNIPFYEHFGFTVMSHSEIPGSGMPHITMRYK